ncbi:Zinc finger bed domain-containing protein 1 [Plakobranchus ocellatus]|uniref:Zinc finger bed domain-containing protein 1 n=1 Tax=Plakobranchus ocellatus TaxID=259542 RepID=A0AAV4D9N8_9GAST|nr:Zinc finger bed domain-containing protein 1 [Plakobranchus ocellatus]
MNMAMREMLMELEDPPMVLSTKITRALLYKMIQLKSPKGSTDFREMTADELSTLLEKRLEQALRERDHIDVVFNKTSVEAGFTLEAVSVMQVLVEPMFLKTCCFYINDIVQRKEARLKHDVDKKVVEQTVADHGAISTPILRWGVEAIKGVPPLPDTLRRPDLEATVNLMLKTRKKVKKAMETRENEELKKLQLHLARVQARLTEQIALAAQYASDSAVAETDFQREYHRDELYNVELYASRDLRRPFSTAFGFFVLFVMTRKKKKRKRKNNKRRRKRIEEVEKEGSEGRRDLLKETILIIIVTFENSIKYQQHKQPGTVHSHLWHQESSQPKNEDATQDHTSKLSKPALLQPTLQSTLSRTKMYEPGSAKNQKLDDLVVSMIVKDLQPFTKVEDEGFKALVAGLDPRYQLPKRRTIARKLLPSKYEQDVLQLKSVLSNADHIAETTDLWI